MKEKSTPRRWRLPAALLAAAWLAACATPSGLKPGTDEATVLARLGEPLARYSLPDGSRLAYRVGPFEQQTWMVDLDKSGRVTKVDQALTLQNFGRVRIGVDTQADVLRRLGPPRTLQQYARIPYIAWLYAYKQNDVWDSEMAVFFDDNGIVRDLQNGPDPRFLGNGKDRDK